ncbi:DsbA family oxidoreductase [Amycolatopsis tolypomycina]|uniref:Predicted dithiol-disulfide isomerase, DsbA family n=1 Tax=Amycolatopsis tolypomycina TaxID=208445 RepID=A0A1H5AV20_9PSEU|nr:DsbA family oxidoreductase [Amycolatopsis tolypomycina]SED45604.1 Predicted dithiol-disulfide isomerase, DsbA family [Amycolatopsis tolypomycina]
MRVDIWSDLVCPWCYLGKRRFERAVAEVGVDVEVVHHSFQLDPSFPRGTSRPTREVLAEKYGRTLEEADAMEADMEHRAAADGLEYHLDGVHMGNTVDGHRLVHLAAEHGMADAVVDRFYAAHFTERRSLFDHDSLVTLATEAGLDAAEARAVLESDAYEAEVAADGEQARALGASGVPFFVIDQRFGVAGAQSPEVFAQVLRRVSDAAAG